MAYNFCCDSYHVPNLFYINYTIVIILGSSMYIYNTIVIILESIIYIYYTNCNFIRVNFMVLSLA